MIMVIILIMIIMIDIWCLPVVETAPMLLSA